MFTNDWVVTCCHKLCCSAYFRICIVCISPFLLRQYDWSPDTAIIKMLVFLRTRILWQRKRKVCQMNTHIFLWCFIFLCVMSSCQIWKQEAMLPIWSSAFSLVGWLVHCFLFVLFDLTVWIQKECFPCAVCYWVCVCVVCAWFVCVCVCVHHMHAGAKLNCKADEQVQSFKHILHLNTWQLIMKLLNRNLAKDLSMIVCT